MLDVLLLFPTSADSTEIDNLLATFVPSITAAEGFRSVRMSSGDVMSRGGRPPFGKVVEVSFDALPSWMTWVMAHPAGPGSALEELAPLILYFEVAEP